MQSRANMVVKGTAPEECSPQMKKLRKNPMPNTMPGKKVAVCGEERSPLVSEGNTLYYVCVYA